MEIRLSAARLRPWQWGDEKTYVRHANNRNVSRNLRDRFPYPYTTADAQEWLHGQVGRLPVTAFAIEVNGEAAGGIGLQLQSDIARRSAEIGYWLGEAHWGRGIMTEAVRAVTNYGVRDLDLIRIFASVFERNLASVRVLEKAGYVLEGHFRKAAIKDGEVLDELMYAIVRD